MMRFFMRFIDALSLVILFAFFFALWIALP